MMRRFLFPLLLLGAIGALILSADHSRAQSMKKKGGTTVEIDGMKSQVYDFWKTGKADAPYLYSFVLPKDLKTDTDAAELTIYPVEGSADDVVKDWMTRMEPPKGFKAEDVFRTEKFKVGNINVTKLIMQGTYLKTPKPTDSISAAKKLDDYRFQGFVIEGKDKKYAVRVVGPFKTVGMHMPDVDGWVKAFK